jgi:hypothetical protein
MPTHNKFVFENVQRIKLHLRGPEARKAIPLPKPCVKLKSLEISVSKYSAWYLTKREFANIGGQNRARAWDSIVTLKDARGVEELKELLAIGGLEGVKVSNAKAPKSMTGRLKAEVGRFEKFLKKKLDRGRAGALQGGGIRAAMETLDIDVADLSGGLQKL